MLSRGNHLWAALFVSAVVTAWTVSNGRGALMTALIATAIPVFWGPTPHALLWLGLLASILSRFTVDVGGLSVRPEHVGVLYLLVLAGNRHQRLTQAVSLPIVGFFALGLIGSVWAGSPVGACLRIGLMLTCGLLAFCAISSLPEELVRSCVRYVTVIASILGAVSVGLVSAYYAFGTTWGVQFDPLTGNPMAYVTFHEANIFGSFMAAALLLSFGTETSRHRLLVSGRVLITLGLLLSYTRSAWLAAILGMGWYAFRRRGKRAATKVNRLARFGRAVPLAVAAVVAIQLLFPVLGENTTERAATALDFDSGTGANRLSSSELALDGWRESPVVGNGFGSFSEYIPGQTLQDDPWIPNLTVGILHDTGILGGFAFLFFIVSLFLRTPHSTSCHRMTRPAIPAEASVVTLLVAFQATAAIVLVYPWIFFGVLAACRRWPRSPVAPDSEGHPLWSKV